MVAALLVASALLVVPTPAGDSSALLGSSPAAAAPSSSTSAAPAVAFADTEYSVPLLGRMFGRNETPGGNANLPGARAAAVPSNRHNYFGELEMVQRSGTDLDLIFKIEGRPDASQYRYCRQEWSTCQNTEVRVLPDKGLLYFWNSGDTRHKTHWPAALAPQRLEVSAVDAGTGLKVYREVLVNPPPEAQGCEDYGDDTVEAYVCLYLRELIPEGAGGSNEAALRTSLPQLVQDGSNYNLVFAEEFDSSPPAANSAGCKNGLSTLDESMWNYPDACVHVDSRGESCGNIADNVLTVAVATKCNANVNTFGKLHYRYGYIEFKYTVNMARGSGHYHNINFIAWAPHNSRQNLWKQYGVEVNDWESFLKYGDVELDLFEYSPSTRHSSSIWHANWGQPVSTQLPGWQSGRWIEYCARQSDPPRQWMHNVHGCRPTDTFTVTHGVEWTPSGYRTFTKVDGYQDELTLWPKDLIQVSTYWNGSRRKLQGTQRDRFFDYVDPNDASTLLEQVGIAHTPNPISFGSFTYTQLDRIYTRVKFDYVRLWQPENHYSDMEPVYQ